MTEDGVFVAQSTVTFLSVTPEDSGVVTCETGPPTVDSSADAWLTVIV